MKRIATSLLVLGALLAGGALLAEGAGGGGGERGGRAGPASPKLPAGEAPAGIPKDTVPPEAPERWPRSLVSKRRPLVVHFLKGRDREARRVLRLLEEAWRASLRFGFREPAPTQGQRSHVFLWPGRVQCFVEMQAEIPKTAWSDGLTYMVLDPIDPIGPDGGPKLRHTVVHELNHMFQSRDDWFEFTSAFEGSATFVEWEVAGLNDELREISRDFQSRPHWSLDRDDKWRTWHVYGYAMYLRFLKRRYARGDASFIGRAWRACRTPPRAETERDPNEPDLVDALERVLPGLRYPRSVVEFARWRYYTGRRADKAHDPDAARLGEVPVQEVRLAGRQTVRIALDPAPMMLGSAYLSLAQGPQGPSTVSVSLDPPAHPAARYVLQAVPGRRPRSDGEVLSLSGGRVRVRLLGGRRTLILTVVPASGQPYDPDTRDDATFPTTVVLTPR